MPMYKEAEFPESLRDVIVQAQPDRAKFPSLLNGEVHLWTASLVPSTEKIERLQSFLSMVYLPGCGSFENRGHLFLVVFVATWDQVNSLRAISS